MDSAEVATPDAFVFGGSSLQQHYTRELRAKQPRLARFQSAGKLTSSSLSLSHSPSSAAES